MVIELASGRDAARITELARFGGASVDVAAELARNWSKLWIAREAEAGEALGFLLSWDAADEIHLVDVVTDPLARRRGVASALLEVMLTHAQTRKARLILLEVRRSNQAALSLYRRVGFCAIGLRRGYYTDNGEDAVEMQIEFDDQGRRKPAQDELDLTELS